MSLLEPLDASALGPALDALPVFPLAGVVLFPRAVLPLHIFEPRYRKMLEDCLASHRAMAMAFVLDDSGADDTRPRTASIAGAGVILQHEALPDGRSNILLHGLARVSLDELPFVPPYRRARARVLQARDGFVSQADRASLHAAAAGFVAEVRRHDVKVSFGLPGEVDDATAADLCAHHLIIDPGARQRVLEELDVPARVLRVTTELAAQTSRLAGERPGGTN